MSIKRIIIFPGILFFSLLVNLLVYYDIQVLSLRAIFSFIFLTIIPGFLILLMLKPRRLEFWEYFIYTIGLSISFLMFGALLVNWILPWIHLTDKPLSLNFLLISINALLALFWVIAFRGNKELSFRIDYHRPTFLNMIFFNVNMHDWILGTSNRILLFEKILAFLRSNADNKFITPSDLLKIIDFKKYE